MSVPDVAYIKRRAPRSWAKVSAAEDHVANARRLFACEHVLAGAWAFACADHVAIGLSCAACMATHHLPRHSDEDERRCDECQGVFEGVRPLVCVTELGRVRICQPRGRRGVLRGPVTFVSVGCCAGCWGAA